MPISEQDIKKLWGLAAGRCSKPGCGDDCVKFFGADPTIIGEMAHVIARQPKGRRGVPGGGSNSYDNLILLCPTHHTEIDKAPEGAEFPQLTCIVLAGDWDAYTQEAKKATEEAGIGLFLPKELYAAIWKEEPNKYFTKDSKGHPVYHIRAA